jgi:phosphoglycolate phosphatase
MKKSDDSTHSLIHPSPHPLIHPFPHPPAATSPSPGWHVECVIYDCDGVMFDSLEANGRLYNQMAMAVRGHPLLETELKYCHTHTVYEALHHLFGHDEALEKKALDVLKQTDLRDFIVYLKMEPNLFRALESLKERDIARAISTNRTTSMKYIMERFGLWPHFDMVVTALDVKHPKPHPESLEKILAALKVDREKALFIGDSEVDWESARSAGVKFIAYKNREIAGDGFIEDHLTVLSFLENGKHPQG